MKKIFMFVIASVAFWNTQSVHAATIKQTVYFENVTPQRLYEIYMSPKEHAAFTGLPVDIEPNVGGTFNVFFGAISPGQYGVTGEILELQPGYLTVQTWRGAHDLENDPSSRLFLFFETASGGATITLVQYDIPDHLLAIVRDSWAPRYWIPLAAYVKKFPVRPNK